MRTTLNIDDDVLDELRERAASASQSLGHTVTQVLRRGLAAERVGERTATGGIPVVTVTEAAEAITEARVAAALADEP